MWLPTSIRQLPRHPPDLTPPPAAAHTGAVGRSAWEMEVLFLNPTSCDYQSWAILDDTQVQSPSNTCGILASVFHWNKPQSWDIHCLIRMWHVCIPAKVRRVNHKEKEESIVHVLFIFWCTAKPSEKNCPLLTRKKSSLGRQRSENATVLFLILQREQINEKCTSIVLSHPRLPCQVFIACPVNLKCPSELWFFLTIFLEYKVSCPSLDLTK